MDLPTTTERVQMNTADQINRRIRRDMEMRVWYYAQNSEQIEERLEELKQEWDLDRALEASAASMALIGTFMGFAFSRKYKLLPILASSFLLQHALKGSCPTAMLLRRLGVRTQGEIEAERYALKALRGDFQTMEGAEPGQRVQRTLDVVSSKLPETPTTTH